MPNQIFHCQFLGESVHLTSERIDHIRRSHPEFGEMDSNSMLETIRATIDKPSVITRSRKDTNALVFGRWEPALYKGKFIVATVITAPERNWIITAFISRYQPKGIVLWKQD